MQQERLHVRAELGDQKRRPVRHQATDEMHVARKPVQLDDGDRTMLPMLTGFRQGVG